MQLQVNHLVPRGKLLQCPKCKAPMIVLEVESVEIDYCDSCHGVWLDGGELELLLETAHNRDRLMENLTGLVAGKEKHLSCPICEKKMDKVQFGIEAGSAIELDKCRKDDGIWFDEGELHGVLKMGEYLKGGEVYELLADVFGRKGS